MTRVCARGKQLPDNFIEIGGTMPLYHPDRLQGRIALRIFAIRIRAMSQQETDPFRRGKPCI